MFSNTLRIQQILQSIWSDDLKHFTQKYKELFNLGINAVGEERIIFHFSITPYSTSSAVCHCKHCTGYGYITWNELVFYNLLVLYIIWKLCTSK